MIYADIIIDISSDKPDRSFQYRVPERLEKKIKAGWWQPSLLEMPAGCVKDM